MQNGKRKYFQPTESATQLTQPIESCWSPFFHTFVWFDWNYACMHLLYTDWVLLIPSQHLSTKCVSNLQNLLKPSTEKVRHKNTREAPHQTENEQCDAKIKKMFEVLRVLLRGVQNNISQSSNPIAP